MAKKKANGRTMINPYKTYLFRNKDPVIDELRTIKATVNMSNRIISELSGVSAGTLTNWFKGRTKRPQSASIEAVGRSMGKKRIWVDNIARKKT